MRNRNERVALEMLIMKYRLLIRRVSDEEFVRQAQSKIAELEKKLREIDQ